MINNSFWKYICGCTIVLHNYYRSLVQVLSLMMECRTLSFVFFIVISLGFLVSGGTYYHIATSEYSDFNTNHDSSKCKLKVFHHPNITLDPPVCGHSTYELRDVFQGSCSNSGCKAIHRAFDETFKNKMCVPLNRNTISGSVSVSNSGGCSETVYYRFENVTACDCEVIHNALDVS